MNVMMMDHYLEFTDEHMRRFVDAGSDTLIILGLSAEEQVSDTRFAFERIVSYVARAKAAGFKCVNIVSPVKSPHWMPDEWFLRNKHGHCASLRFNFPITTAIGSAHHRITSYWNPEPEAYLEAYTHALRAAVEPHGGSVMSLFGSCGESFFPCDHAIRNFLNDHYEMSPWYYDDFANASWQESGLPRVEWWARERIAIIRRRMSWADNDLLPLAEYGVASDLYRDGIQNISEDMLAYEPRPKRIIFTLFWKPRLRAVVDTKFLYNYRTWVGAEGVSGLVPHATWLRDNNEPAEGLICGPIFRVETGIDTETYRQVEQAVAI